jgi:hypothetical protein
MEGLSAFRLAIRNPYRILGFVIQNAVSHEEGLGKPFDLFKNGLGKNKIS